jgi:hypothetical protein
VLTVASWHRARTWTMVALDANARIVARIDRAMPSEFGSYPMQLAVLSGTPTRSSARATSLTC